MKIQMIGTEWKEVGTLTGITSLMLNGNPGKGTIFESSAGVKIFFSQKDMDILSGTSEPEPPRKLF